MRAPRSTALLLGALLLMLPLAGCLSTLSDLTGGKTEGTTDEGLESNQNTNATGDDGVLADDLLPGGSAPVARMRINAEDGVLLYKADFEAKDVVDAPIFLSKPMNLTLLATDSEALDGARLDSFEWRVAPGEFQASGRSATVPFTTPGIYMVELKVKDSRNNTDTQMVHVGLRPSPFTVTTPFSGAIAAGSGATQFPGAGSHAFPVESTVDGKPVKVTGVTLTLTPASTAAGANFVLTLSGAEGEVAKADTGGTGRGETLTFAELPAGAYTAGVTITGVKGDYTLTVAVTYLEIIEGLTDGAGGDGHDHAH